MPRRLSVTKWIFYMCHFFYWFFSNIIKHKPVSHNPIDFIRLFLEQSQSDAFPDNLLREWSFCCHKYVFGIRLIYVFFESTVSFIFIQVIVSRTSSNISRNRVHKPMTRLWLETKDWFRWESIDLSWSWEKKTSSTGALIPKF